MTERPSLYRWAAEWGIALSPSAMRSVRAEIAAERAAEQPRTPADLLAEIAAAAGTATCNATPED